MSAMRSRYGNAYVRFPSVAEELKLEYELVNFVGVK